MKKIPFLLLCCIGQVVSARSAPLVAQEEVVLPVLWEEVPAEDEVFVVEAHGNITSVRVLLGVGHGCDQEALRVVNLMPHWEPGLQKGKPVRVAHNIPFSFRLDRS